MTGDGARRPVLNRGRFLALAMLVAVSAAVFSQGAEGQKAKTPPCVLAPELRDVTVNQGVGAYSPLVNGKETLVRLYLSMPSCAASGALIQIKEGSTLTVSGGAGGTVANPTPVPIATAYPTLPAFTAAPMADSTGDPKFVVPASFVTSGGAFTATFTATIRYQQRPNSRTAFTAGQVTFSTRPGTNSPITAAFAAPSNALATLFVPMGDATRTYSSQWSSTAQQALQDGMTGTLARLYPLPAGVGELGGTGGLRYSVTPTLLDLGATGLNLMPTGKFCGTGSSYDLIKAQLAQFRLSHNTVNPNAQANRVVGVVDPAVALAPPNPCFEGMSVVNSQEAWALALPNKTGQLVGLELAHTLGLTPPSRESPFDGAHSQNQAAENPSLNRRFNLVQRAFIPADRSLLKPSATNPPADNVNTLLEVPDYSFLLCVFGGPQTSECETHGPGTVSATAPVAATLSFVMSGTTTGEAGLDCTSVVCTGTATGTSVVESYFASGVPQTSERSASEYRLVQRNAAGEEISNRGVPVEFRHSEHGQAPEEVHSGLFSFALPFETTADRVELWKGAPEASGSLLLYARNRTAAPVVTNMTAGGSMIARKAPDPKAATLAPLATYTVTNTDDSGPGSLRQAILDANANPGPDTITFEISGNVVHTIAPSSELPHLQQQTTLDGTTEDDYVAGGAPRIEISGASAGPAQGIWVEGANSIVRGLTINRFTGQGIYIAGTASNTRLEGNYIGLDSTGTLDAGNSNGIQVLSSGNTIGGPTAAARNVIAGNDGTAISLPGGTTTVQGNYIGTTADGLTALGNVEGINLVSNGNTVGGPNPGEGNVLSGSTTTTGFGAGVTFSSAAANNVVEGNLIGTNKTGTGAIPNSRRGVYMGSTGSGNVVRGNLISGNSGDGVFAAGSGALTIQGNHIGTTLGGGAALGNTGFGIQTTGSGHNNEIGGEVAGTGNVVAGNGVGIALGSGANRVLGNSIGVNLAGASIPNLFDGIQITGSSNTIGDEVEERRNRIRNNGRDGIRVFGGTNNRIVANAIGPNGALGVDLSGDGVTANDAGDGDTGPNNLQNYPILSSATGGTSTSVSGSLDSAVGTYRIHFFASASCTASDREGERYIGGRDVSPGPFTATSLLGTSAGEFVTANAIDSTGNTSEFSNCVAVGGGGDDAPQPGPTFTVNTNTDGSPVTTGCTTDECTLREAIDASNADEAPNTIAFDIGGDTQIDVRSGGEGLPYITGDTLIDGDTQPEGDIVIDGSDAGIEVNGLELRPGSAGSEIRGLEVRGFFGAGIRVVSANNIIQSNIVRANGAGIALAEETATGNVIGADADTGDLFELDYLLGNVVVENRGDGIAIGSNAGGNKVAANFIGTDRANTAGLGNGGAGISVEESSANQLGPGNRVTGNGDTGVHIVDGSRNRIVANFIYANTGRGIELDETANGDLRAPTLDSATLEGSTTTVEGSVGGVSDGSYFVEFFVNAECDDLGEGEGESFVNYATVNVTGGSATFSQTISGLEVDDVVTATLTDASVALGNTSEFSNCVTVAVVEDLPEGQEPVEVTSTDDNPADNTLDLYLDCGASKPKQVIAVGLRPDSVSATTASWSTNYDSTLAPASCSLQAVVMDGFTRSGFTATGTETVSNGPNPLVAAISNVREGSTVLQYGLIALRGSIRNAEGERPGAELQWSLSGPGVTRSGTGTILDLQPPSGGWPAGQYTATLTKPGATESSATDTVTFTVVADADNDGIPKAVDDGCVQNGGDSDPSNADDDKDGDGIPNADDSQPCVAATSYTAIVDVNPDPLPTGSNGSTVTVYVRVPGRNVAQILAATVRITRIADEDVSTNDDFRNTAWTINGGVGTAKFDRQKLVQFLTSRNLRNRIVTITVGGRSGAPVWSFEGSDTIFVQG